MAGTTLEVVFDVKKHITVCKGSIVGENGQTGYLVYPMPPVGTFDLSTDKLTLKAIMDEMLCDAVPGGEVRAGSEKSIRKVRGKALHRAFVAYFGQ